VLKFVIRDTVASVGVVRGNPFPLTSSAAHICTFRHALALDERCVKFLPEYIDGGSSVSPSNDRPVNVKEVVCTTNHTSFTSTGRCVLILALQAVVGLYPLLLAAVYCSSVTRRWKPVNIYYYDSIPSLCLYVGK